VASNNTESEDKTYQISILAALTQPNPPLHERPQKSTKNTTNKDFLDLDISQVKEWHDFTYENLYAAFADILSMQVPFQDVNFSSDDSACDIENENGVDYVMDTYITKILRKPIKVAADVLQIRNNAESMQISFHGRRSNFSIPSPSVPNDQRQALKPDWVIYSRTGDRVASVMGDSKLYGKWTSSSLQNYQSLSAPQLQNLLLPIRQMATYCLYGGTAYGFLITSHELVAINMYGRDMGRKPSDGQGLVRYRSVKWSEARPGQLTVKLAIFFLTAIAFATDRVERRRIGTSYTTPYFGLYTKMCESTPEDDAYYHQVSRIVIRADSSQMVKCHIPRKLFVGDPGEEGYILKQRAGKILLMCSYTHVPNSKAVYIYILFYLTSDSAPLRVHADGLDYIQ
jgi:hypothetical protein